MLSAPRVGRQKISCQRRWCHPGRCAPDLICVRTMILGVLPQLPPPRIRNMVEKNMCRTPQETFFLETFASSRMKKTVLVVCDQCLVNIELAMMEELQERQNTKQYQADHERARFA